MSLNNISLPPAAIADLYSNTLIETGEIATKNSLEPEVAIPIAVEKGIRKLGSNNKQVLIVVNSPVDVHLPDNELDFLTNMLSACKMTIADVAIVNIHQQSYTYKELLKELNSRTALLFDIEPAGFGLPMSFPFFQIQPFAGCSFLYAPSLQSLETDKVLKSKLWVSLRRLFNI